MKLCVCAIGTDFLILYLLPICIHFHFMLVDELFENYFSCASIIYGYDDDDDDDDDRDIDNSDVLTEEEIQKLREQWSVMREKYIREVHLVPIDEEGTKAIVVPTRIGYAGPKKGKGVFATEPIPKDTLVLDLLNKSTPIWKTGHSWREFAVTLPREAACNFIEWSWVQTIPPENEYEDEIRNGLTIFSAFDESNLMNSADWDGIEANINCGSPPEHDGDSRGVCRFHYYASRNIEAGEELLINYSEFEDVSQQGWVDIGL